MTHTLTPHLSDCPLRGNQPTQTSDAFLGWPSHQACPLCHGPDTKERWEFLVSAATLADLQATSKAEALHEIVDSLVRHEALPAPIRAEVLEALMRRERLASTGVGRGFAIPHTRHPGIKRQVGAVARSRPGIDFQSADGEPVHLIFLIVTPADQPREHLLALSQISQCLGNTDVQQFLRGWRHAGHE